MGGEIAPADLSPAGKTDKSSKTIECFILLYMSVLETLIAIYTMHLETSSVELDVINIMLLIKFLNSNSYFSTF